MIKTDFHLHTNMSTDSSATIELMVQRAIDLGLTEIAFTDHDDHNPADEGAGMYDPVKAYQASLSARQRFGGTIAIRHGVEIGEPHLFAKENQALYQLPLDIIIGSVHCIGPYGVHSDLFDHKTPAEGISEYFRLTLDMAKFADMDVLGHLDYFDRYTALRNIPPYNPNEYEDQISAILEVIISRNIALEINTSGLRSANPRPFPHPDVLKWHHRMGGRLICIGSDAHRPEQIAYGFEQTEDILRDIGFCEYHVFRARKPHCAPIKND
ncbi:MAG: histidinol-phosphatase HisJ family protein [Phycisphaerae bacterium]